MLTNKPSAKIMYVSCAALVLITFIIYFKTFFFQFINYDDPYLLYNNYYVNSGLSIKNLHWAVTATDKFQWVPVTWLTHMLDFQFYGRAAGGHHLTNVILHLLNTVGVLLFLYKTTDEYWKSLIVAALFALHPLHVEPVAWVSARKDMLSTWFFLITLFAYLRYVKRLNWPSYLTALGLYTVTLMAKPMYVTLPILLLIIDCWPLQRMANQGASHFAPLSRINGQVAKLVVEKIPFMVISAVFSVIAYFTQSKAGAVEPFQLKLLTTKLANIVTAYAGYVWKTFWPAKLAVIYPYQETVPLGDVIVSTLLLVFITVFVVATAKDRKYLLVGWLWFLVTLLPVIGIVRIGEVYMADKFCYVAILGLFIITVWGGAELCEKLEGKSSRKLAIGVVSIIILLLSARSWVYLSSWRNNIALYAEAIKVTEKNYIAHGNMGAAYNELGNYDEALKYFSEAIRIEPYYDVAYAEIGRIYMRTGDCEHALPYFQRALSIRPENQRAVSG